MFVLFLYKVKAFVLLHYNSFFSSVSYKQIYNYIFTIMDSTVVHSHVQEENDEQNSQNVEPYPVTLTHGPDEHTEPEKTSVMSRVKAKARKVRDSIKKQLDHGNGNSNEIQHTDTPDDDGDLEEEEEEEEEDKEIVQDPQVHQVPSEKPHYNPLVGGASLTTAINQKNATDKAAEEKQEQREVNLERSIVSEEEDSQEKGSRPEAYTLPNYQTKDTDPSGEVYDSEDIKNATPTPEFEKDGNLGNSGIDFEGTKVKGEEPYHDTPVEENDQAKTFPVEETPEQYKAKPVTVLEEYPTKQGIRTEEHTLPNYQINHTDPNSAGSDGIKDITQLEESLERINVHDDELKPTTETTIQPSVADTEYPPAAGSHDQSVPHFSDATTTENEHPRETVPTHIIRDDDILVEDSQDQESNEIKDITPVEESLERLNVHDDEPKPITEQKIQPSASAADTEYPQKFTDVSHDQFVSRLSDVTETQNEYPQVKVSTDINRNHEIPSETEETFNTNTNTVENQPDYEESAETQPKHKTYIDETEISSAETADKTLLPESYESSNLGNDGTTTGSNNDGAETKNDDKKEDGKLDSDVEKPEKVLFEESNVNSPGKGMVDRVKDYYGSWFAKPEENQSTQGNSTEDISKKKDSVEEIVNFDALGTGISAEDISKKKDSVAEVEQVVKVVD
ncbi:unnamed protein product [Trifolium pratense]|uniref:Uncharacterized protein n=1 Tax=Trifolium pratense TaxID=57577 RepID=A0ACB0ICP6_TRIPR|nr:unnamed protein product [Trifolium pratense]